MTNEERWDKRRKSFKLYNRDKICFLFPFLFTFHQINLLKTLKNVFVLFSSSNLLLVYLLQL